MKPTAPSEAEVQAVADALLAESRVGTIRPTVSTLAQRAGITRPTLYRNYPDLVERFTAQATTTQRTASPQPRATHDLNDRIAKLRHENEQLRLHLDLYEEHIRRLTIENTQLANELVRAGACVDLTVNRRRRQDVDAQSDINPLPRT